MELLDRYLQAVKKHLPWQRQDDIIAELRANLEAQLEDKEAALGHELTSGEAEEWLKQIGPPMQMAARYQPQQYLIGPTVFPTYWFVLKMASAWAMIVYTIVSVVRIATESPNVDALVGVLLSGPGILMTTAAWVTLIFAAIEYTVRRNPPKHGPLAGFSGDWTPSTLPPVEADAAPGKKRRSLANAVAEVIFGLLFLCWLLLIPEHPFLLVGPGFAYMRVSPFQFVPVFVQFYWAVVAINVLQVGWNCANLWRGRWQLQQPLQSIATKACGLIPMVILLSVRNHAWVLLKHPELDMARYGGTLVSINRAIYLGLVFVAAITVLTLLAEIARVGRDINRKRAAAL